MHALELQVHSITRCKKVTHTEFTQRIQTAVPILFPHLPWLPAPASGHLGVESSLSDLKRQRGEEKGVKKGIADALQSHLLPHFSAAPPPQRLAINHYR